MYCNHVLENGHKCRRQCNKEYCWQHGGKKKYVTGSFPSEATNPAMYDLDLNTGLLKDKYLKDTHVGLTRFTYRGERMIVIKNKGKLEWVDYRSKLAEKQILKNKLSQIRNEKREKGVTLRHFIDKKKITANDLHKVKEGDLIYNHHDQIINETPMLVIKKDKKLKLISSRGPNLLPPEALKYFIKHGDNFFKPMHHGLQIIIPKSYKFKSFRFIISADQEDQPNLDQYSWTTGDDFVAIKLFDNNSGLITYIKPPKGKVIKLNNSVIPESSTWRGIYTEVIIPAPNI